MSNLNKRPSNFHTKIGLSLFALFGLIIQGCGSSSNSSASLALTCTANATAVSGTSSVVGGTVEYDNLSVFISNGIGPYTITIPGLSSVSSSSSSYTYPSTFASTSGSSVTITDTATAQTTTCAISSGLTQSGSTSISVTATPSTSAALGTPITLTANSLTGLTGNTFTYSLETAISGVTLNTISSTQATVTSSIATTVTVLITEYSAGVLQTTSTETLTFGGTGSGTISVTASPSAYSSVGTPITLFATDITGVANPTFTFALSTPISGITLSTISSNQATVTSAIATAVTVMVTEYSSGIVVNSSSLTVTFGGGSGIYGGTGGVIVTASPSTTAAVGTPITLVATSTVGLVNPTFTFTMTPAIAGITLTNVGTNVATITSSIATTATVMVYEYASGVLQGTTTTTVSFSGYGGYGGYGGTGSLQCYLSAGSLTSNYYGYYMPFSISTSTGEPVQVTLVDTNNSCAYDPTTSAFELECSAAGPEYVQVWAQGLSSGMQCNGGSPMVANIYY